MSGDNLNLNPSDMIHFWKMGFMKNPVLNFDKETALKHAEDTYKLWETIGGKENFLENIPQSLRKQKCRKSLAFVLELKSSLKDTENQAFLYPRLIWIHLLD